MPRFFLHLWDHGGRVVDYEGEDLTTLSAARSKAIKTIRTIIDGRNAVGLSPTGSAILIEDDTGRLASTVTSEDVLALSTP